MLKAFSIGALAYPALELLYRGRTHYSMALAGGVSTLLLNKIKDLPTNILCKSLLSGSAITGVEYLAGRIWNQDYSVWDYRHVPLNWKGQICVPYFLLWCGLGAAATELLYWMSDSEG